MHLLFSFLAKRGAAVDIFMCVCYTVIERIKGILPKNKNTFIFE